MRKTLISLVLAAAFGAGAAPAADPAGVFAVVGEAAISVADYETTLQNTIRQKFYHGQVPEAKLREFQREVAEAMIERALLLAESRRRCMSPDGSKIAKIVAEYEQRYAQSANWRKNRDSLLPGLRRELEQRDLLERLQAAVRSVEPPAQSVLRAYYEANPGLFTEPEQTRLSVILLKVDPSSPRAAWDGALEEAQAIRRRIAAGADFAELARIHSTDATASRGGDMGYLHKGMIPDPILAQLSSMAAGGLSDPIRTLEGVALFRFDDRKPARLRAFGEVVDRAGQLWRRDKGERQWTEFAASLRRDATVRIDTSRYPALAGIANRGAPGPPAQ